MKPQAIASLPLMTVAFLFNSNKNFLSGCFQSRYGLSLLQTSNIMKSLQMFRHFDYC